MLKHYIFYVFLNVFVVTLDTFIFDYCAHTWLHLEYACIVLIPYYYYIYFKILYKYVNHMYIYNNMWFVYLCPFIKPLSTKHKTKFKPSLGIYSTNMLFYIIIYSFWQNFWFYNVNLSTLYILTDMLKIVFNLC